MDFLIYETRSSAEVAKCKTQCERGKPSVEDGESFFAAMAEHGYESILNGQCVDFTQVYQETIPALVLGPGRVVPEDKATLDDLYEATYAEIQTMAQDRNADAAEDASIDKVRFCMKKGVGYSDLLKTGVSLEGLRGRRKAKWSTVEPDTKSARKAQPASCFLKRGRKYPVCPAGSSKPSCTGLRAAFSRAMQQGDTAVAKRALRQAKRFGCSWFKTGASAQRHAKRWKI